MSNRLPAIAADLADLHSEIQTHNVAAAEKAIAAGRLLTEAKALAGHGTWLPFLAEAGIPDRTAQNYMRLWRSGLNAPLVADLGGIRAALSFLAKWRMPGLEEALYISIGDKRPVDCATVNFAFVWRDVHLPDLVSIAAVIGNDALVTQRPMPPGVDIEGHQPVDAVLTWLEAHGFLPIGDWHIEIEDIRMSMPVIASILRDIYAHPGQIGREPVIARDWHSKLLYVRDERDSKGGGA
ncbi:DUF3102 domain-containing protein [Marinibacterium profundimaris]|uniref:Uncharacterized protein n=1 Tax=Marinibacterium profundimaris TaxID=1679460 RepID=A0A225NBY4_9RHOB|nr:DUF3102 domain-containing protein [Marinibacterium profundimaris]OWU67787.1 hypothetical protein ATO3_25495 [Marinibacterium profundimaris]